MTAPRTGASAGSFRRLHPPADGMPCSCSHFLAGLSPRGPYWGGQSPRRTVNRSMPNSPSICASVFRHSRWGWTLGRSIDTPISPNTRVTRALYYSPHALQHAWRLSHQRGYFTSRPCFTAHWYHTRPEAIDIPYCGAGGQIRPALYGIRTSRPRPAWTALHRLLDRRRAKWGGW